MRRKTVWLLVSCVMVLGLMLAVGLPERVMSSAGEPIRGGWLTVVRSTALGTGWDPIHAGNYAHLHPVLLALKRGDFYRGPAGSNEISYLYPAIAPHDFCTRGLAKSWEMTGPATIRYHLHKGVHWHDKPPMNGREVTAEDLVWGYQRLLASKDSGLPTMAAKPISIKALDKYTLEWTLAKPDMRTAFTIDDWYRITPREAAEKHGNLDDWKNMVGNGPFMLKEYVAGNKIVYEKNPNYHETDLQGRKVPFIDGFTTMIIKDDSTRWAALRTGKIDIVFSVPWRDAKEILKSNPNLQTTGSIPWYSKKLQFNVKEGVFADLKVRRAMTLAIDHMSIVKDFHEGNSVIMPSGMFAPDHPAFMKLEEYPKTAQELYEYNPEKAKKLLAQAGYPKGFKAEMEIMQIHSDYASMLVSFWQATGLDIKIKVLEAGAFVSRLYGLKLNLFMLNGDLQGPRRESWRWSKGAPWNFSNIDDQNLWDLFAVATAEKDRRDFGREWQKVVKYLVDQVYEHQIPGPNVYNFWQPWVKNYHGELTISSTDYYGFAPYIWLEGKKK